MLIVTDGLIFMSEHK